MRQQAAAKHEETFMKEKTQTNTKQMEAPIERILEAEPVGNNSIGEMVKQMSRTMDKGLEDYKAEEKKVD